MIKEIIPSNLNLTINIAGQNNDNLNGDGSGVISCSASASNAINYEFRFGNGVVVESTTGKAEFTYTNPGINNYDVYVYAYSETKNYIIEFEFVSVYVNDDSSDELISPEEFNELLAAAELKSILTKLIAGIIVFFVWIGVGVYLIPEITNSEIFIQNFLIYGPVAIFIIWCGSYWALIKHCFNKGNYLPILIPLILFGILYVLASLGY